MNVLITGAAGRIGSLLTRELGDRHHIRGFDLALAEGIDDSVTGDLEDISQLATAMRGVEAVIHLAAAAGARSSWAEVLRSNIIGTRNVFEAARENGVRRIAFASRAGLLADYPANVTRTVDLPLTPGHYYSVSKAFGEQIGYMYAHQHDMEVVCVRIGNFDPDRPDAEHPHHLGHADAVAVFERAILHPGVKFEVVFGVSDAVEPLYDLDHGRRAIGYYPQQKSGD